MPFSRSERQRGCWLLLALFVVPFADAGSQTTQAAEASTTDVAAAFATLAAPMPPDIDGRLDEEAWAAAVPRSDFTQQNPDEGAPGTERTEFRIMYTDAAVYVGIRAYDSQADLISAQLTRRDEESPSDWVGVGFDSYHDRRTAFVFLVNAAGVKRDIYFFDDNNEDTSWDAVWDVATSRDAEGWTAEFRIPFSQLRFAAAPEYNFGLQVYRRLNRLNEEQFWRLPPKDQSGFVSRFGELVGIQGITPPRRIEVMPYVSATGAWGPSEDGNPFQTGTDHTGRVGADFNIGVTSNLTLSATINPDFGQVEADPAVVNLSAFETFFPEKRPFFNEGIDIFRFPIMLGDGPHANEQLFYSRRVGRAPQGEADERGGYAESLRETTILGAGKLSGKTPSGWTVGLIGALTAEEQADVVDSAGTPHRDIVEPRSGYFVGRLARDFRDGQTQVGLFTTVVDRALPSNLTDLRSSAYAGGLKWSHRFRNDTWSVRGWVVGSHVRGSAEAIEDTQTSSAHYYQRPDNDYVTFDPTRTSLSGYAGQLTFGKHAGNWRYSAGIDTRSPGFEVNDVGFQRDADRTIQFVWLNRRWLQPGKVFRNFNVNFNQYSAWSYGWDRLGLGGNVNTNFTLLNYWSGYFGIDKSFAGLSKTALRGGPAFKEPSSIHSWAGFHSDSRKSVRGGFNTFFSWHNESGSWVYDLSPNISARPATNIDLTFAPSLFRQLDTWQYLDDAEALGTDHYIFGKLEQTTLNMTLRANLTFTPDMSLQVYAQPFVSSGDVVGYRRVADPRANLFENRFEDFDPSQVTEDEEDVYIDLDRDGASDIELENPDFTFVSFRSNVVLRWEYTLGSTLFLVWQHGREDDYSDGRFRLGSGLRNLFGADQENTFVIKFNYWLSL
jgi:hypothetical protein